MQKYTASVITAGCLWGLMGLFTRTLATYGVDSTGAIVLRCGIAALLFAVTLLVRDSKQFRIRLKDIWCFIGTGICSLLFFTYCYFQAITIMDLSTAAVLLYTAPSIVVSFCPKFAALVSAMPTATIGGVSLVLYGMISAVGVRNVVENKVDFTNTRNVIIAALILVLAIGITYSGSIQIGVVSLSGLAVSSIVGILLNAILPGKDYTFEQDDQGATSVDFKV